VAKLGWLILGLLVLWAHPSHATMTQCPDGAHWYNSSDGVSACPDSFTVTGASASTTSVTLTGTVDEASGTVHSTIRLNCTLLQWRNTTQGTGAEASADDTDVSSGAFSINVTGLAEGTSYCAHLVQYTNNRATVQKTIQFTTTESAPPPEDVGTEITGGDDRFYCPDGNDANSGLTNALRKATIPSTDSTFSGGDDMWLCTGGVWINSHHDIARQGTSGNWNEIGTYYMDSTTPRKALDGVFGPGTTHTKAVIKGALTDACLAAGTCTYPSTFPEHGYSSQYDGIWDMASTADYTEIRNIVFSHYQYNSLTATGGGTLGALNHLIFDGVDMYYGGLGSRLTFIDGVTDFVVRNGDSYGMNSCESIRQRGTSSDTSACSGPGWSGTFLTVTRKSGRGLVEWNTSRRGFGEGYNCYNTTLGKMIYRNNYFVNGWSGGFYLDGCPDSVIESNITLGGSSVMLGGVENTGPAFSGVGIGCESTSYPDSTGNVVRNNLFIGARIGISLNMDAVCTSGGQMIGAKVYGNTTIGATNLGKTGDEWEVWVAEPSANVAEAEFTNNAHWNDDETTDNCSATSAMDPLDNAWSHNPADSDCDGAGDTIGSLGLTLSTYSSWTAMANVNGDDPVTWPTWSQANPAGGSGLIGSGTALTSAILDKDTYGFAYEQIREVLAGSLTEAEWECALCVDAEGTTRANPPSKGAVE
jgi:hypothetical protein